MVTTKGGWSRTHFSCQNRPVNEWIGQASERVWIRVWVVPGSSRTEIAGLHGDALKVRVAAPAEKGKANRALLDLLSDRLGPATVRLVAGGAGRSKTIEVAGADLQDVERRLLP